MCVCVFFFSARARALTKDRGALDSVNIALVCLGVVVVSGVVVRVVLLVVVGCRPRSSWGFACVVVAFFFFFFFLFVFAAHVP